jgi:protein-S-isoprenylcysteine O-methyltransferase Ste14
MVLPIDPKQALEVRERFLAFINKERVKSDDHTALHSQHLSSPQNNRQKNLGRRIAVFAYGVVCYAMFFGTFLYAVGFVGNLFVPKSIDSAPQGSLAQASLVNGLLLGVFAIQHSLMARPFFKRWWMKIVPKPAERSTYVLFSSLALILMFWQWQPMGGVVWDVQDPAGRIFLLSLFAFGWLLVLTATFLINHFDLFGLRQVTLYLLGREYRPLKFMTPGPYKFVRHPLYVGWFFCFWATPTMTVAHLVFAIATTAYILMAIQWEERDLLNEHGKTYEQYRRSVPMLIPIGKKTSAPQEAVN